MLFSVSVLATTGKGVISIIVTGDLEAVKSAFNNSGIMLQSKEGGFETEEILLDEGTRAMYKAHDFDNQVKITAFWGITQKAKGGNNQLGRC